MLSLYWRIGCEILEKQKQQGWGANVIKCLSKDLSVHFPDDRGYSARNLRNMKRFAECYTDFPIWQVPLAKLRSLPVSQATLTQLSKDNAEFVQVPLAQIDWYHHISLMSKVKDDAERAFYIMEAAQNGWSRDVMMLQIANGYIQAKGKAINNFKVKTPEDKPTIGLLLCRTKSDNKVRFALRGITQPMGISAYETEKLFEDVASSLPQIDDLENDKETTE